MTLSEGQMLGQYKIVAPQGQGGMAAIYKAYHPRLDRYVAIKVMHPALLQDPGFLARFEREAQIVARLEHPHIVPVYDYADINGQPYLVMKLIDGRTLRQVNDRTPIPLEELLRILPPIASALDYAHHSGVLHRDIKPSNIIIAADGTPYLTDFGLARLAQLGESSLSADAMLGTPNYISPEQALGRKDIDFRSDLYSLGVVIYELLVGCVPFAGDTPYAVVHNHIYAALPEPRRLNPELPPQVEAVLIRALAKDPAARYESATALVEALRAAVAASGLKTLNPERSIRAEAALNGESLSPAPEYAAAPPPEAEPAFDPFERVTAIAPPLLEQAAPAPETEALEQAAEQPERNLNIGFDNGQLRAEVNWGGKQRTWSLDADRIGQQIARVGAEVGRAISDESEGDRNRARRPRPEDAAYRDVQQQPGEGIEDVVHQAVESIEDAFETAQGKDALYLNTPEAARKRAEAQVKKRRDFIGHTSAYAIVNVILWVVYIGTMTVMGEGPWDFPWALVVSLAWGAGLISDGIETYFRTGARAAQRTRAIFAAYEREYGPNWNRQGRKALRKVRKVAEKPFDKRREWLQNLGAYVTIVPMLWVIFGWTTDFMGSGPWEFPWPLMVMLGWGLGVVIQGIDMLGAGRRGASVEREMERERAYISEFSPDEKIKRKNDELALDELLDEEAPVRLSEDGELTDSMVRRVRREDARRR